MKWNAIHMFIHDMNYHAKFLVDYLKPVVEKMQQENKILQFFYISYWQGGNHIRFRYKSEEPYEVEKAVHDCFQDFLLKYEPKDVLSEEQYYAIYANNKEMVDDLTLVEDRSFLSYEYEPETARYGGEDSIPFNEMIFEASSKYALRIRQEAKDSVMKRVIGGLDMFTLAIMDMKDRKSFLSYYRDYWNGFSDHNRQILPIESLVHQYRKRYQELLENPSGYYSEWKEQFHECMNQASENQSAYRNREIARTMMTASQVHMNHNRLGLFPQLEPELAEILYECECG